MNFEIFLKKLWQENHERDIQTRDFGWTNWTTQQIDKEKDGLGKRGWRPL